MYDLVQQVRGEVADFLTEHIPITSIPAENNQSYDYKFSQRENVSLIDLYWNSQFKSGKLDAQGNEKLFLNVGKFRTEVAEMQIDIDVSNFLFVPTSEDYWTPWFMSRDFHAWVRENDYGETINDWGADLPRYGTAVSKKVGDEIKRVAISRLMNTQDCYSLKEAATSGGYVIEQMELTQQQAENYPDWNIDAIPDTKGTKVFYERYGLITEADIKMSKGEEPEAKDWEEFKLGIAVVCVSLEKDAKGNDSALLFAEFVAEDDFPYEEVHWARQDGRWQGIGVMEEQFQNQLAKNLTTHYRMKNMMWAGKKMFYSNDVEAPNNLSTEVKDGGVIALGTGGQIQPVNTQTQHLSDFQSWDNQVDAQADKTSFTYEAATGDSPKAGTPYSLQVQVDNTLQKHFGKKKERYGAFLRRIFFDQQVPIFKKNRKKAHIMSFSQTEEGVEMLREAMIETKTTQRWLDERLMQGNKTVLELKQEVTEELIKSPYLVVELPAKAYDNAKFSTDLILTGERRNIFAEMETVKTLLQDARAEGDVEGANKLKRELVGLTGRMPMNAKVQQPQQAPQAQAPMPAQAPNPVLS